MQRAAQRSLLSHGEIAVRDTDRESPVWPWFQSLVQDLRFPIRVLVKDRGATGGGATNPTSPTSPPIAKRKASSAFTALLVWWMNLHQRTMSLNRSLAVCV